MSYDDYANLVNKMIIKEGIPNVIKMGSKNIYGVYKGLKDSKILDIHDIWK